MQQQRALEERPLFQGFELTKIPGDSAEPDRQALVSTRAGGLREELKTLSARLHDQLAKIT